MSLERFQCHYLSHNPEHQHQFQYGFLNQPQSAPGGRSYSLNGSLIGSLGSGTSGVREVDDTVRELRKENFNLKLRIYFLEERLGSSNSRWSTAQVGSKEERLGSSNSRWST